MCSFLGNVVDYIYYAYSQNTAIFNKPFLLMNNEERVVSRHRNKIMSILIAKLRECVMSEKWWDEVNGKNVALTSTLQKLSLLYNTKVVNRVLKVGEAIAILLTAPAGK